MKGKLLQLVFDMSDEDKREDSKLKAAFESCDTNGDGGLSFEEFWNLLKRGIPTFPESEAHDLFRGADTDGDGKVVFNEFVDYIYGNTDFGEYVSKEADSWAEDHAKQRVMLKSIGLRQTTAKNMKGKWFRASWQERLEAIEKTEIHMDKAHGEEDDEEDVPMMATKSLPNPARKASMTSVTSTKSVLEGKTQNQLVDYSIHRFDLQGFAGQDEHALREMDDLRRQLKTLRGPEEIVDIQKYIAKGTAGWVFLVTKIDTGEKRAMKCIRMTQGLSGIKEWYISKILRKAGITNVVLTDATVSVMCKEDAPDIIAEHLTNAGPVPFYMCLLQEFISGGSLEDVVRDGRLSTKTLFTALADVASTLADLHANNVNHKDVKPENVLVEMKGDTVEAAKLCDFGSAEMSGLQAGRADDIRRFGVTMFSLVTGESWTKCRLIHETHVNLVARLKTFVMASSETKLHGLPKILEEILSGFKTMENVAAMMKTLSEAS